MLFNTPQFVIALLFFIGAWYITPNKWKKIFLLLFNYFFIYLLGGMRSAIILLIVSLITYLTGICMTKKNVRKCLLVVFLILLSSLLFISKYAGYTWRLLGNVLRLNQKAPPSFEVLALIGLSYYIFSAISYVVDVYRKDEKADQSFLDVAVWLSLFTKIIAGPIERHKAFKAQLSKIYDICFDFEIVKRGLLICSLGYFYKMVISDRIGIFVDTVYANLSSNEGITLLVTMVMYSLQIYFDFAGYSLIAYGVSYALDLKIVKNFDHPYFSTSVSEFWKKWHISLSSWLKDYVYIPLGGNRKGSLRQYFNLMVTFLVSGIWHGVGGHYVVWGALHGVFQICEKCFPIGEKWSRKTRIVFTFVQVSFAWIFFRAMSIREALRFIKRMFVWNPWILFDGTLTDLGLDIKDWFVLLLALTIVFVIEIMQAKGISIYQKLQEKSLIFRWVTYYLIIVVLLVLGIYGTMYDASNFIYFKY